jgi:hypothetical protein
VDAANARHLVSLLARPAAVLQTRSVKAQRKASKTQNAAKMGGIFYGGLR